MGLKLLPEETNIPFTKWRMGAFALSAIGLIASVFFFLTMGLNFGIDFKGGIEIEVAHGTEPAFTTEDLTTVRTAVGPLVEGEVKVKSISAGPGISDQENSITVTLERQLGENLTAAEIEEMGERDPAEFANQLTLERIKSTLVEVLGEGITFRQEQVVGPAVSGELVKTGITAVVFAVLMMLVYIWFRFEWQFSLGAVLALVHDVVLTIGMFALVQLDFGLAIVAAILTIVGYSMNDTVVVYDRVRENLRKFKKKPLTEVLDLSINDTLSRTIMTSVTTLLAVGSLFLFGGPVLKGFTAAIMWGIFIGTYSSIFIAAPVLLLFGVKRDWSTDNKTV